MKRIIELVISIIFFILYKCFYYIMKLLGKKGFATFVVLYYHEILPEYRNKFKKQMQTLARLTRPVNLDYQDDFIEGKKYSAVTFDDAFQSVLDNALEELCRLNIPITIFVPTAYLGQHPGWDLNGNNVISQRIISIEQLKKIDNKIITIGSHTRTHPQLTDLDDIQIEEELLMSKIELEEIIGQKVEFLAFPYGYYNMKILEIAKESGYRQVYKVTPDLIYNRANFVIGRIKVQPADWPIEFKLKVIGCYNWLSIIDKAKFRWRNRGIAI